MKVWRSVVLSVAVVAMVATATSVVFAMGSGYTPGSEGGMGSSLPPPGFHYKQYNILVNTDDLRDDDGNAAVVLGPDAKVNFSAKVFAQAHRFIYFTEKKIFGADYGMDLIVPIVAKDIEIKAIDLGINSDDSNIGLGDIFIEPLLLSWHKQRWDFAFGLGVQLPTGAWDYSNEAANGDPGSGGYGNGLLTLGATYYFDEAKSWTISALTRTVAYFGEQDDTNYQPGDEFIIDWGVAKQFSASENLLVRPAIVGYTYWQISDDQNRYDGVGTDDDRGQKYAVGAEINFFWLPRLIQFNLRWLEDIEVRDEYKGSTFVASITCSF
ncbi:MAG: transporter [Pseudomonadota bacterium]